ncbi:maleylacetoacetate isomerase [soil metagenome]
MLMYGYFRSSAAYRVRIALNLKGLAVETLPIHLTRDGGQHLTAEYAAINPEKLVPALQDGETLISQSLAILEYLEERHPEPPLLPRDAASRATVRSLAALVACDVHPLNNLRVLKYLEKTLGVTPEQKLDWIRHWITAGFDAIETRLTRDGTSGLCCFGDLPTFADCCLIPQVFSARRFDLSLDPYPAIRRIDAHLNGIEAFAAAAPGRQADAE